MQNKIERTKTTNVDEPQTPTAKEDSEKKGKTQETSSAKGKKRRRKKKEANTEEKQDTAEAQQQGTAERQHKNALIIELLSDPKRAEEALVATTGADIPADAEMLFLGKTLRSDKEYDISFFLKWFLVVLFEHQSTWNPNMAIRLLGYIDLAISDYLSKKSDLSKVYLSAPLNLPNVVTIIFYDGTRRLKEEEKVIKLRFEPMPNGPISFSPLGVKSVLSIEVPVVDLLAPSSAKILDASPTLRGYAELSKELRIQRKKEKDLAVAITRAFDICIKNNSPISDFLIAKRKELESIVFYEISEKEREDALRLEGKKEGKKEGIKRGKKEGEAHLIRSIMANRNCSVEEVADLIKIDVARVEWLLENYPEATELEEDELEEDELEEGEI
jgi:predicted transposase YdaD